MGDRGGEIPAERMRRGSAVPTMAIWSPVRQKKKKKP